MLFSCKITNSVLHFLEGQGEDVASYLELTALPEEFLKDPSFWIPANDLEKFLSEISQRKGGHQILTEIGHKVNELHSWGVLDSVLKMLPKPDEIWAQPGKFLSYFVSPPPPVVNLEKSKASIRFEIPIPSEQFPNVVAFLTAAFEAIPSYQGLPIGTCSWSGTAIEISWNIQQESIFNQDPGYQVSPKLLREVASTLESHGHGLEEQNLELQRRKEKLTEELARKQIEFEQKLDQIRQLEEKEEFALGQKKKNQSKTKVNKTENEFIMTGREVHELRDQIAKMTDYMVRAQQLVTVMVSDEKMTKGAREAMKRLDWEIVKQQFPETVKRSYKLLDKEDALRF